MIVDKSFGFAISIVKLYQYLCKQKGKYVLSKQLLKSGTSIGVNASEVQEAQSTNNFISKLSISLKEARETKYRINLLIATDYLHSKDMHTKSLLDEIDEIIKLLTSIVKTTRKNYVK